MNKGGKPEKDPEPVECLCGEKLLPAKLLSHAKLCNYIKINFASLPETIDNSLKAAKDTASARVLYHLFTQARNACKSKIRGGAGGRELPEIPRPVPVPRPPADLAPQTNGGTGRLVPATGEEEKDRAGRTTDEANIYTMIAEQNSVLCKLCATRFTDFNLIMYLQRCPHAFCKEDLKKLIFRYSSGSDSFT